jgi:shikimate kinase
MSSSDAAADVAGVELAPATLAADSRSSDRGPHVLLIGMMGTGKTSMGRRLADRLGYPFVDSDAEVVRQAQMPVTDYFATFGEPAFRNLESTVIKELCARTDSHVIAFGGGAVIAEANRSVIRSAGIVVWLRATPETIIHRVGDARSRPLLQADPEGMVRHIDAIRRPIYAATADLTVDVDGCSPRAVVEACLKGLGPLL